jgi:rare lipoprotein A
LLWIVLLAGAFLAFDVERAEAEEVLASWYGPGFAGQPTASGENYDPNGLTAAHKTLPLGTKILVSYGGRTVPVTITDRGPFEGDRELDLSQGAARALGFTQVGVDYVDWTLADGSQPGIPQVAAQQPVPAVAQEPTPAVAQQPGLTPAGTEAEYVGYPRSYPPAQEAAPSSGSYIVQPGDTLASIAAQQGISVDDLANRNGISDPNLLYSGQALYFPLVLEDPSGAGEPGTMDGAMSQNPLSTGYDATTGGGAGPGPVSGPVTPVFHGGAAVPMGP